MSDALAGSWLFSDANEAWLEIPGLPCWPVTCLLVWDPALAKLPEYLQRRRQGTIPLRMGGKGGAGVSERMVCR